MSVAEFKQFVKDSSLADEAKAFWERVFGYLNDDEAGIAARFVDGNPRVLIFYTDTMRRKYEAFLNHDREGLDDVLNLERTELASAA